MPTSRRNNSVFFTNTTAARPLDPGAFRHTLEHATQGLAQQLRQSQKHLDYCLNAHCSVAPNITEQHLDQAANDAQKAIQSAFNQQHQLRKSLAEEQKRVIRSLKPAGDQERPSDSRLLLAFKANPDVLPTSASRSTGTACCASSVIAGPAMVNATEALLAPKGCDHEERGGIVIDLDEAAHGTFASTKYLSEVAKGQPEAVMASFKADSEALNKNPIQFLGDELTENGVAEFSTAVGAGALMLPLAALAVKAGVEEWKHGNHELQQLNAVANQQSKDLERMQNTAQILGSKNIEPLIQAQKIRLSKTDEAKLQATRNKQIGFSSAASGLTIGLKALSDMGLKISLGIKGAFTGKGFFALSESAQTGTAAAGTAIGFGIAGTFVLGPLAGLFATALGVFFTLKTIKKLKQLKTDFECLKGEIKSDTMSRNEQTMPMRTNLEKFLIRQGEKRIAFFKLFGRWNKAFMVGSGLYAASAVTKAVVIGVTAAGVAVAASNPIGLAVLTAVGIVGAIAMGIASLSFFYGHGKQSKYSSATAADHPWVDRKLLTDLHSVGLQNNQESVPATTEHPGFEMAAHSLQHLDQEKNALRQFLGMAAKNKQKRSPLEKNLSWWPYFKRQVLTHKHVAQYLQSEEGLASFKTYAQQTLIAKGLMLAEKLHQRARLIENIKNKQNESTATRRPILEETANTERENNLASLQDLASFLGQLDADYAADQGELELTLLRLKKLETETSATVQTVAEFIGAGVEMKPISKFLLQEQDRNIRHARGVLFESQLEGARLREVQFRARQAS